MAMQVTFQAVLRCERLVAIGHSACERSAAKRLWSVNNTRADALFAGVGADVGLQVVAGGERLAASVRLALKRLLAGMRSGVFAQVGQGCEELETGRHQTVERVARV